jgi:proteasome accessory factor A
VVSRREANALLPEGTQMLIYKNNSDRKGNSYGSHENYLMDRRTSFKQIVEHLMPFFVTRQVYAGAGKVGSENRAQPCDYQLSQRADFFETEVALDTMVKRPIINTRDEPHADREKYRRLHVIVGDSNMSEYTNFLKIGSCAVVLQMIEDNYINKDFTLRNPVKAIKDISYDTTCKRKLRLDNGREYSPIEIQREYCEMAQKYVEQYPVSDELRLAVGMWQETLDALDDDPSRLSRKIDWLIKRALIESFIEQKGTRWNDPRVFMLDLQFHDIRVNRGLYYLLERRGAVDRILSDDEIIKAKTEPPPDTRARMRGEFIKLARQNGIQYDLDWSNIRLGNLLNVRVICNNPFETDTEKVAELVRTIQKTNLRKTSLSKLVIQS